MNLDPTELAALEKAIVRGWPALAASEIDGWLARWSSGGSIRANSVAALTFTGPDIDGALANVVRYYRDRNAVPRFTITDIAAPAGLDRLLEQRGWQRTGQNVTYTKDVGGSDNLGGGHTAVPVDLASDAVGLQIDLAAKRNDAWSEIYLAGLSPNRRAIALQLVDGTPEPRVFFSAVRQGEVIASGLSVLDGALASVQCVATRTTSRRTGAATALLGAIERHAVANSVRRIYLQTEASNTNALRIYERLGFRLAGTYHTRELRT